MSRRRKHILWIVLVVTGLVSITAGVSRRASLERKVRAEALVSETESRPPAPNAGRQKEKLGYEVIQITRFGFEPSAITRSGGRFFLAVENRSGTRNLTLRLDPEHGNRLIEITQPADQLNWVDVVRLPPGRYSISTADQPDRVCQLTIT